MHMKSVSVSGMYIHLRTYTDIQTRRWRETVTHAGVYVTFVLKFFIFFFLLRMATCYIFTFLQEVKYEAAKVVKRNARQDNYLAIL